MTYINDKYYNHLSPLRTGALLVNLGTPQAPTTSEVGRYLKEFLSDRRVIEVPRMVWWLILRLAILPFRSGKSARAYAKIWTPEGSPLLAHTRNIARALEQKLKQTRPDIIVSVAMTYGSPDIAGALDALREANVRKLLVLPLFPQYSATTTGAVFDAVTRALRKQRWLPELRFINSYHDHPQYIAACAKQIAAQRNNKHNDKLILSFHGLPKRNLLNGDPYHCQCHKSARLIAETLQLADDDWTVTFQSRFGAAEWLKPYTDHTLIELGKKSKRSVSVFCPGFAADCLETLEEIAIQNRDVFADAGGKEFQYIPALNDCEEHIAALDALVRAHLQGWETPDNDSAMRAMQLERAQALGAD